MSNDSIIFQIIDWNQINEADNDSDQEENHGDHGDHGDHEDQLLKYKIRLYGRTIDNKSIYVNVENFTPFFYIEVPLDWNMTKCLSLVSYIKSKISNRHILRGFKNFDILEKKKLYGFTGYKNFKFIRLIFLNMKSYKSFEYWIEKNRINYPSLFKKPVKLQLYESNIDPFIRCMHIRKLNACGLVEIKKYENLYDNISHCEINVKSNWTDLNPSNNNSVQKFIIASFDIECMSESGNFPQASNEGDKIIQIGTVFSYYGESEPYFKHIITLGGCTQIKGLEDVEIESYKKESNVLLAWTKIIQKMNPDIITGYNINGFDFQYMHDRAKKLNILSAFSRLSKLRNEQSMFKEKKLSSSALGDNLLKYFEMDGRIIIDLMKVLQRDAKLDSYKLDHVASNYIKEKIIFHEKNNNYTNIYTESIYGIKEEDFINISFNDGLTDNKYEHKYKILKLDKIADEEILIKQLGKKVKYKMLINGHIPDDIFFTDNKANKVCWCHAKDDVSPKDMFRLFRGSDDDRGIIAKYCVMDCILVTKLMEKLQVLNNNMGMANVCHVPLSYIFMRGQGIKIFSLVSKKCRELDHLIPKMKVNNNNLDNNKFKTIKKDDIGDDDNEEENVGYEGATVFPPVKGVHYEPIPVLDYASLYPRSMICINISHECIVNDLKYDDISDYNYQTITYNNNDGTTTTCKYAKKNDGTKGILPLILIELLEKRSSTKKLMEKAEDVFLKNIYDGLQLAYKVTANSLYGQVGAPTSPIYMKELAASTTAMGRKMLEYSRDFIEGSFGDLINLAIHNKEEFYDYSREFFKDTPPSKFIEPKFGRNGIDDFMNYFYEKINKLITPEFRVKPKVIYGDSVTGETPILLLDTNNNIIIKNIKNIGKYWSKYENYSPYITHTTRNKYEDVNINYKVWTEKGWMNIKRVIKHYVRKRIYRIVTQNSIVDVTEDHSLLNKNHIQIKPKMCRKGMELLHSHDIILDNYNNDCCYENKVTYIFDNQLECQMFYINNIKKNVYMRLSVEDDVYKINIIQHKPNKNNYDKITNIIDLGIIDGYVYDLETTSGTFQAGIGFMIVKNTDSVFFSPKIHNIHTKEIRIDRDALKICIEIGKLAGDTICKVLPEPEEQVYEKTFWPFIILTKKRYVGNLYEDDDSHFYQKSMGIVLKRRDNAKIVKIVVGGIVDYILNGKPSSTESDMSIQDRNAGAINYTRLLIKQILRGEFPIDKFIISKTLRADYKDRTRIVHAVLADRIAIRDPGNKPDVNDRIPYVYIIPNKKVLLQGERVEDPKYVLTNQLEIDYLFYLTNQIMKPSIQFLELIAVSPEKLFENYINKEINRRKKISSIMDYVCDDNINNSILINNKDNNNYEDHGDHGDHGDHEEIEINKLKSIKINKKEKSKDIIKTKNNKSKSNSLTIEL